MVPSIPFHEKDQQVTCVLVYPIACLPFASVSVDVDWSIGVAVEDKFTSAVPDG